MLPLDELRALEAQVESANELEALRPIFNRVTAIARENPDDFEVALLVDHVRQRISTRGTALKGGAPAEQPQVTQQTPWPQTTWVNAIPVEPPAAPAAPPPQAPPQTTPQTTWMSPVAQPTQQFQPTQHVPPSQQPPPQAPPPSHEMRPDRPTVSSLYEISRNLPFMQRDEAVDAPPPPPITPVAPPPPPPVSPQKPPVAPGKKSGGMLLVLLVLGLVGVLAIGGYVYKTYKNGRQAQTAPTTPATGGQIAVEVETIPSGAAIQVNGQPKCTSGCNVNLTPGDYQITAILDGFDTATKSVNIAPGSPAKVSLTLVAQPPSVRLLSDLESGKVMLDGQAAGELQDGQITLDHVAPGKHTVQVVGKSGEVSFPFETAAGSQPTVTGPVTAKNIFAAVITSMGSLAKVYSSSNTPLKVSINGQPQGEAGPQGLELRNVNAGDQAVGLGEGQNERKLVVSFGRVPAITAFLKSDVNAGTLVVSTGEDDVSVFLNGKEYRRKTKRGILRVQTLGKVAVRVAKPGFEAAPEQVVDIKKGEESKVAFQLKAQPKFAALQIHDGVPGTQILVDEQPVGRVGQDGSLTAGNLSAGEHVIEVRRDGFVTKKLSRPFKAGEALTLGGSEIVLPAASASVHLAITPPDAQVSYHRFDESQVHAAREPNLKLDPGSYVFTIRAPNYAERTAQVTLTAGETRTLEITLARAADAQKPKPTIAVSWNGWSKQGDEYVRKGGNRVVMMAGPLNGTISFTARLRKGGGVFHGGKLRWFVEDSTGSSQFEIDKKHFQAKGPGGSRGKDLARGSDDDERSYSFEIEITPDRVLHRIKSGDTWVPLDTQSATAGVEGKFGFNIPGNDEIGVSELRFKAR